MTIEVVNTFTFSVGYEIDAEAKQAFQRTGEGVGGHSPTAAGFVN